MYNTRSDKYINKTNKSLEQRLNKQNKAQQFADRYWKTLHTKT